jgi:hypothetical protein
MKMNVGLWVDHKKAVLATVRGRRVETHLTISHVEKQLRRTGSSPLKGSFDDFEVPAGDSRKRAFLGHLNVYYDTVIAGLGNPDGILIMGPGEAKVELKKRLMKTPLGKRIVDVQPADKMTDTHVALQAKKIFAKK